MDERTFENKITEALHRGTKESIQMKDEVWKNIQKGMSNQKGEIGMVKSKNKRRTWLTGVASTAAALLLVFFTATEPGHAAVKMLKEALVPEKDFVQEIEGQKEKNKVQLNESEAGYSIYIDEKMYTMEKMDGKDRIVPVYKPDASLNLPEVYMEISQVKDQTPEALLAQTRDSLKKEFPIVREDLKSDVPFDALVIGANSGTDAKDTVVRYIFVDNKLGGSFVIKQQYFLEAAEGHGARFYNMLKEFRITEAE